MYPTGTRRPEVLVGIPILSHLGLAYLIKWNNVLSFLQDLAG